MVLIDSRTGITDAGGICTILLPDFLVLVLTANEQSYAGTLAIARSAQIERRRLCVQPAPLMILPVLSRFDRRDEIEESDRWLRRFAAGLKPMYADWLPSRFDPIQILEVTKIPYVTRFSFGEPLPVLTHSLTDPELPGFYLENCARLLASDFREAARIIDPEAKEPQGIGDRIRGSIQRAPIDEQAISGLVRQADADLGEGPDLASLLNEIGAALSAQARPAAAEPFFRRALAMNERHLGADHQRVGQDLNDLALLLHALGRCEEAEPLMRRALAIGRERLGQTDTTVAVYLNNLAQILQDLGRFAEAEPLMREALAIEETTFGAEHPNVARYLSNLAMLLEYSGRSSEVEPLIRRALEINERSLGSDHPDIAVDLTNLAQYLQRCGRTGEVEPLLRRALAIDERHYGPNHPEVASDLSRLARFLRTSGGLADALSLLQRAIQIGEANFGSHDPRVAQDQGVLGSILLAMGRVSEAQRLSRRALIALLSARVSNGYRDAGFNLVLDNYRDVLIALSCTEQDIAARLREVAREVTDDEKEIDLLQSEMIGPNGLAVQAPDADHPGSTEPEVFDCFLSWRARRRFPICPCCFVSASRSICASGLTTQTPQPWIG